MAERNEKVFGRVREELLKDPKLGSRELYELAQGVDKSIGGDTLQQFHARYVLPVKREQSGGRRRRRKAADSGATRQRRSRTTKSADQTAPAPRTRRGAGQVQATDRDQVRALFLQFAQELTDAESRSSLVQVLGRVDSYVDRIAPAKS